MLSAVDQKFSNEIVIFMNFECLVQCVIHPYDYKYLYAPSFIVCIPVLFNDYFEKFTIDNLDEMCIFNVYLIRYFY